MTDGNTSGVPATEEKALEGISVSPPVPADDDRASTSVEDHPTTEIREGADAGSHEALASDPSDADAKLDIELDETFPSSDAPSNTRPGSSGEPAPSSGYDPDAEPD
jgi:hypothetical protein